MSYPPPIEGETAERLYRQAIFFYNEYERVKREVAQWKAQYEAEVVARKRAVEERDIAMTPSTRYER